MVRTKRRVEHPIGREMVAFCTWHFLRHPPNPFPLLHDDRVEVCIDGSDSREHHPLRFALLYGGDNRESSLLLLGLDNGVRSRHTVSEQQHMMMMLMGNRDNDGTAERRNKSPNTEDSVGEAHTKKRRR